MNKKNQHKEALPYGVVSNGGIECFRKYEDELNDIFKSIKLWQPKEGEWCWFYASIESNPMLGIFERYDEYSKYYQVDISVYGKHSHPSNHRFSYCEPFIGQLPNFLKDK